MLFDISGKKVFSKNSIGANYQYEFNTSGFSDGVYIVKLSTKTGDEITKKVEIIKK